MTKREGNIIVDSMAHVYFSKLKFPTIVVYENPYDYPDDYVARVWETVWPKPKPMNIAITRNSLKEIREDIMAAGFGIRIPRADDDDPHIVETWMR